MFDNPEKIRNRTQRGEMIFLEGQKTADLDYTGLRDEKVEMLIRSSFRAPNMMLRGDNEPYHYDLLFFFKGIFLLETKEGRRIIEPGSWVGLPSFLGRRLTLIEGEFSDELYIRFLPGRSGPPPLVGRKLVVAPASDPELIDLVSSRLFRAFRSSSPGRRELESLLLLHIYKDLGEGLSPFHRLWEEVEKNPSRHWTAEELCRQASLGRTAFFKKCRDTFSMTPLEKLTHIRMNKACFLLAETDKTLSAIAADCGYGSAYSFSQVFTSLKGIRPGKWRKGS